MMFKAFANTAKAELLASGLRATVHRDNQEWWLAFVEPGPLTAPSILNIPVKRDMLETRADVAGFVAQAVAMAKEEFEAMAIARDLDRNLGRMYKP